MVTIGLSSPNVWRAWVLDDHYELDVSTGGQRQRTYLGELVFRSKYQQDSGSLRLLTDAFRDAVLRLQRFRDQIDGLGSVSCVAAVPCNPPKVLSVPHALADVAAVTLAVPDISSEVSKTRPTDQAKTRAELNPDAYLVGRALQGESVLLVDDLYRTGATLESVAFNLRKAGAAHVVGLCVTKAHKGMNP